jgi:hypothetical protein
MNFSGLYFPSAFSNAYPPIIIVCSGNSSLTARTTFSILFKLNEILTDMPKISGFKSSILLRSALRGVLAPNEYNGVKFSLVDYRDPETGKHHHFISTLPESINPGTIAMLYYKRWTIEKAFNNSKSDLKDKKAWSSTVNSLMIQMRLTAMTYNLVRMFEETSKIHNPELIHPSDDKYTQALKKREIEAKK